MASSSPVQATASTSESFAGFDLSDDEESRTGDGLPSDMQVFNERDLIKTISNKSDIVAAELYGISAAEGGNDLADHVSSSDFALSNEAEFDPSVVSHDDTIKKRTLPFSAKSKSQKALTVAIDRFTETDPAKAPYDKQAAKSPGFSLYLPKYTKATKIE